MLTSSGRSRCPRSSWRARCSTGNTISGIIILYPVFDRWSEEDGDLELEAEFRVDENGFYIYWKSEGRDGDVLDLSQVCRLLILIKSCDFKLGQ